MQLAADRLMEMLEELFERIKLEAIMENRTGNIETFKVKYDLGETQEAAYSFNEKSKILIIGVNTASIKAKDIQGIFKAASIPEQFEIISYDEAKNFNLKKLEYTTAYSDIFIGTVPHSMKGMGDMSSGLLKLEEGSEVIYPKLHVLRKENKELGINKTNLKQAIQKSALMKMRAG
ncbi:hypothetical protein ERX27_09885 [Macrococcus brunensis]|uniref:Uncharacterized protein n=1 Tax=Macrococcus brunensis TaxID=198483 RepID=A0A4R6BB43_9STAP|nr:hypothetical protein [Macrococcus brunensis]TDL94177.1 hypothetical protein ERX27_09885 [Macrococcus brunensis]